LLVLEVSELFSEHDGGCVADAEAIVVNVFGRRLFCGSVSTSLLSFCQKEKKEGMSV
jgi:hypothetical protein